jgi:D-aspartate ligase
MLQSDKMPPAVVVSGLTMALGVVRALGTMGVRVAVLRYDRRDTAHLSRWCSYHQSVPHPESHEAEFIEALMAYAACSGGGVLFPVTDEALVAVARNLDTLHRSYLVACPPWPIVRLCIEKQCTHTLAQANGVPEPHTFVPASLEDVQQYGSRAQFPCLVKPCQSHLFYEHFHRKMLPVRSTAEMLSVYCQARDAGLDVMLQEIIPGDDSQVVNYNAYFHRGAPAVEFTAEHIRNAPPSWGSPRVAVSKDIPEVLEPGRKLFQAMAFDGYACTEFKRDPRDGLYKLMDINPRHNLSTLLAVRCGINFPWLHYRHLAFGERPSAGGFRHGVYWIDLTRDAGYSARYLLTERYSPAQYLRPYVRPHVFAILDATDPAPFIKRCGALLLEALRRLMGLLSSPRRWPVLSRLGDWRTSGKA